MNCMYLMCNLVISSLPLERNCIMETDPFWQISADGYCIALPSMTESFSMAWQCANDFGNFFIFGLYVISKVFNLDRLDRDSGISFKLLWARFKVWSNSRLPIESGIFLSLLLLIWSTWKLQKNWINFLDSNVSYLPQKRSCKLSLYLIIKLTLSCLSVPISSGSFSRWLLWRSRTCKHEDISLMAPPPFNTVNSLSWMKKQVSFKIVLYIISIVPNI